jgi:hypothetical protein
MSRTTLTGDGPRTQAKRTAERGKQIEGRGRKRGDIEKGTESEGEGKGRKREEEGGR